MACPALISKIVSRGGCVTGRPRPLSVQWRTSPVSPPDPSVTTLTVQKRLHRLIARGVVSPSHTCRRVIVTLQRKRHGTFVKIARNRPTLDARSHYRLGFERPAAGRCRIITRFPATTTTDPARHAARSTADGPRSSRRKPGLRVRVLPALCQRSLLMQGLLVLAHSGVVSLLVRRRNLCAEGRQGLVQRGMR